MEKTRELPIEQRGLPNRITVHPRLTAMSSIIAALAAMAVSGTALAQDAPALIQEFDRVCIPPDVPEYNPSIKIQDFERALSLKAGMNYYFNQLEFLTLNENGVYKADKLKGAFELLMGAEDFFPPTVYTISVRDSKTGKSRTGIRGIENGVIGYFDQNGKIPISFNDEIEISTIPGDENGFYDAQQEEQHEKDVQAETQAEIQGELSKKDSIRRLLKENGRNSQIYLQDWISLCEKLLQNRIKLDPLSLEADGRYLLRFDGKASPMLDDKTIKLIRMGLDGGKIGEYQILPGYTFRLEDLPLLYSYSHSPKVFEHGLARALKQTGIQSWGLKELLEELFTEDMDERLGEADKYYSKMRSKGAPVKNPSYYLYKFQHLTGLAPGEVNTKIYRDRTRIGVHQCAVFTSKLLDVQQVEGLAPALFARLIMGGGQIIWDVNELQPGDVIFFVNTYTKGGNIDHAGYVENVARDSKGVLNITMRHHDKKGVVSESVRSNDNRGYFNAFYGAVRPQK